MVDLEHYEVTNPEWMIPRDGVALEHLNDAGGRCLVACSTIKRTLGEMVDAAQAHEARCQYKKEN